MISEAILALLILGSNADSAQGQKEHLLAQGTPVFLRLTEAVKARALKTGAIVSVQVGAPIVAGGCEVLPSGAPAEMLVVHANAAGLAGQPDRLELRAYRARDIGGTWIPLEGEYSIQGEDRMLESVGAAATVSCLFLFMKGDPVVIAPGSGWTAFVAQDLTYKACR